MYIFQRVTDYSNAVNDAADNATAEFDPTTRQRRGRGDRGDLGLGANGRVMYCDYHDHGCGDAGACMAVDMLQQRDGAALARCAATSLATTPTAAGHGTPYTRLWWHGSGPIRSAQKIACACPYVCCIVCAVPEPVLPCGRL